MDTPTYVICLDKTRAKRCDPTYEAWKKVMTNIQRLKATTPSDFDLTKVAHPYAQSCIALKERKTLEMIGKSTEVACSMSHMDAWTRILKSGKPGIVVEDDMAMSERRIRQMIGQLDQKPKDTELYLLYFIGINLKHTKLQNGYIDVHRFTGTQAYWITPQACQKLLKFALPVVFQVDTYMARSGLKVRSRQENKMSWLNFMKDGLGSTLGGNHISSIMLAMTIAMVALVIVIIVLSCLWAGRGMKKRHELQDCEVKTHRLQVWKQNHK